MMLEGDDHNAQIAAALLGIVDDPMNHFKLVRLKDELVDDYNQRKRAEDGAEPTDGSGPSVQIRSVAASGGAGSEQPARASNVSAGEK